MRAKRAMRTWAMRAKVRRGVGDSERKAACESETKVMEEEGPASEAHRHPNKRAASSACVLEWGPEKPIVNV